MKFGRKLIGDERDSIRSRTRSRLFACDLELFNEEESGEAYLRLVVFAHQRNFILSGISLFLESKCDEAAERYDQYSKWLCYSHFS